MKKVLTIILVLIAIPLYSWDIFIVVKRCFPGSSSHEVTALRKSNENKEYIKIEPVKFESGDRNPFLPYKTPPQIKKTVSVEKLAVKAPEIVAPSVTISGIMWNPSNPIVMLNLPDGSGVVAKVGQAYGDIVIKAIEKNRIQITYKKKDFWIER